MRAELVSDCAIVSVVRTLSLSVATDSVSTSAGPVAFLCGAVVSMLLQSVVVSDVGGSVEGPMVPGVDAVVCVGRSTAALLVVSVDEEKGSDCGGCVVGREATLDVTSITDGVDVVGGGVVVEDAPELSDAVLVAGAVVLVWGDEVALAEDVDGAGELETAGWVPSVGGAEVFAALVGLVVRVAVVGMRLLDEEDVEDEDEVLAMVGGTVVVVGWWEGPALLD